MQINSIPLAMCLVLCATPFADADAILVPENYATITQAIDAAVNGDVIHVGPGVYPENLYIYDKAIAIRGDIEPGATVIDGSHATSIYGSCVVIGYGATQVVLDSLTLRGGTGSEIYGITRGGGLYMEWGRVELVNVTIEECSALRTEFGAGSLGGAVCNYYGSLVLQGCTIRENQCDDEGGALCVLTGSLALHDCKVMNNTATIGGALYAQGSSEVGIDNCQLSDNVAWDLGGAIASNAAVTLTLEQSTLARNVASEGGAVVAPRTTLVYDCNFNDNQAALGSAILNMNDAGHVLTIGSSRFCGDDEDTAIVGPWEQGEGANSFEEICAILGDIDGDGVVNGLDLTLLLGAWEVAGQSVADLNGDDLVDGGDLSILLGNWNG